MDTYAADAAAVADIRCGAARYASATRRDGHSTRRQRKPATTASRRAGTICHPLLLERVAVAHEVGLSAQTDTYGHSVRRDASARSRDRDQPDDHHFDGPAAAVAEGQEYECGSAAGLRCRHRGRGCLLRILVLAVATAELQPVLADDGCDPRRGRRAPVGAGRKTVAKQASEG